MIIVQLKGGLGNQLFQYAAALSLATHHNVEVKVDITKLKAPDEQIGTVRNYDLQHLVAPPQIASEAEIKQATAQNIIKKYYQKFLPSYQRQIFNEKKFPFDVNFFSAQRNIYLKGYRQSEKYFIHIEDKIRKDFRLKESLIERVKEFSVSLLSTESVSIHIRRGDYTNAAVQNTHGSLSKEYYQNAIALINSSVNNPSFYIFSDDVKWAKENLEFNNNVHFVSGNISTTHFEDHFLMSQCKHNIIANSTFSWWAAWLNENKLKTVIAPKKWYNKVKLNTSDLIPPNWLRI